MPSQTQKYPRTGKRGAPQAFARKLFEILENEDPRVIGWSSTGDSFMIRDLPTFIDSILLKYFRHQKFSSFQRQLNLYGFRKIHSGVDNGGYSHPDFHAGHPELLGLIRRTPQSNTTRGRGARGRSGSFVSAQDDDDDDYEDNEEEQPFPYSRSTRSSASSCISTFANCFAPPNSDTSAPPPSYDAVMKADAAQFYRPIKNEIARNPMEETEYVSTEHYLDMSEPIQETSNYYTSRGEPYPDLSPDPTYYSLTEENNFVFQPVKLEPSTNESAVLVVDPCNETTMFNSMGSIGSFDINDEVCMQLETQQPTDIQLTRETSFAFAPPQYFGIETPYVQQSNQGVSRPNFSRMFSTQSQEWDMDMNSEGLDKEIDFDSILQELTSSTPSYSNYSYQNSQQYDSIPQATPIVHHQTPYPIAVAQVIPDSYDRRYNTRAKQQSFYGHR